MYKFAILIAAYSYCIFILGVLGLLNKSLISVITVLFLFGFFYIWNSFNFVFWVDRLRLWVSDRSKIELLYLLTIMLLALVNLIGALGPELSFDALWYHLTIPKIFINEERIFHIPGNLLYYSDMPKLVEMLYIPALVFGNEVTAKIIHFLFGLGCLLVVYKLARLFVKEKWALTAVVIFYSNLVIDWLSIAAYIDLGRTFFEALALYYLLLFIKTLKHKWLIISAILMGAAVTAKLISVLDVFTFAFLILLFGRSVKNAISFLVVAIIVPLPWILFSFVNTGNPIYPFFSMVNVQYSMCFGNLVNFIHSADPISPIYLICLPLIIYFYPKYDKAKRVIVLYSIVSFIVWFITPQIGGGRFLATYLPAFSVTAVISLSYIKSKYRQRYIIALILLIAIVSVIYRGGANLKYVNVVLGLESKDNFLIKNLNYKFGDFYDEDGFFKKNIESDDVVLIYGIHNLYYVNFPFIHESWRKPTDQYNYILVGNGGNLPFGNDDFRLTYQNKTTNVKLYKRE